MKLGTLVAAGLCGAFGLVAGRASAPAAPMVLSPHVSAPAVVVAPTPAVAAPVAADDTNDEQVEANDGGADLAEVFVQLQAADAQKRNDHLVIRGQVSDQTGQLLAGVTVIVTSPNLDQTITALTDENGKYNIANLPAGSYRIDFYYADFIDTHNDVASREIEATILDEKIDTTPVVHEYVRYDDSEGIDIDSNYIQNIPVEGRAFGDTYGVSFTGTTSLENTYYEDVIE